MPNGEPGLPRNAYASEGFSIVGFLWKPEAADENFLSIAVGGRRSADTLAAIDGKRGSLPRVEYIRRAVSRELKCGPRRERK